MHLNWGLTYVEAFSNIEKPLKVSRLMNHICAVQGNRLPINNTSDKFKFIIILCIIGENLKTIIFSIFSFINIHTYIYVIRKFDARCKSIPMC